MLWVSLPKALHLPLISKAWSRSELVFPSAVSVLCLAGRVYSIPCKSYLVLGPTMYLTTDDAESVTSSQLYTSGGWAAPLIKVNTTF